MDKQLQSTQNNVMQLLIHALTSAAAELTTIGIGKRMGK